MKITHWRTFLFITTVAVAFWTLLFYANGCAPAPKFANGDKTAYVPPVEVIEPDMPGYKK